MSSTLMLVGAIVMLVAVLAVYFVWQYVEGDLEMPPEKVERRPDDPVPPFVQDVADGWRRWRGQRGGRGGPR